MLDLVPVMPVVVAESPSDAVSIARALVAGGLPAIELTLRTPAALDAISAITEEVPEIVVGAGTIVRAEQAKQALVVRRVQADAWFVQDVHRTYQRRPERSCQVNALAFAAGKRVGKSVQGKIAQPNAF